MPEIECICMDSLVQTVVLALYSGSEPINRVTFARTASKGLCCCYNEMLNYALCIHIIIIMNMHVCLFQSLAKRKNWLQRWFVLDFDCQYLAYFESKTVSTWFA